MLINPDLNTLLFYFDSYVNRFFTNTLLNYHYYLIGMFFGLVNYVIQKGININDTNINKGVLYLNKPIQVVNYIKYVSNNNKVYLLIAVSNFSETNCVALSTTKFCTEGKVTTKVSTIGQNIRNNSVTDSTFNNIFVTLRIQQWS